MKDDINLLPPAVLALRTRRLYMTRAGHIIGRMYLILLFVLGVQGLLYATFISINKFSLLPSTPRGGGDDDDGGLEEEVHSVNQQLQFMHERILGHHDWTGDTAAMLGVVPLEVRISALFVQETAHTLTIRGSTSSRTAVLDFQAALERLSWVERVEAPLQNLAVVPTGEFTLTLIRQRDDFHVRDTATP